MRPAYSKTETAFIKRFLLPLNPEQDNAGNMIVRVGDSETMFCCHTDTVHKQEGKQKLATGKTTGYLYSIGKQCLGADDTAGVWLMMEMIKRDIPGLYVFHRGEEIGCEGARHIAEKTPSLLDGIKRSIEFDRFGTSSVITHQMGMRCCSNEFATALSDALGLNHVLDAEGLFTDNAEYTTIIPEVTNISVGYDRQHTKDESLDPLYLRHLLYALCTVDLDALPTKRDPEDIDTWGGIGARDYPLNDLNDLVYEYPDVATHILEAFCIDEETFVDIARSECDVIIPFHRR
jgi:hypothetical protein